MNGQSDNDADDNDFHSTVPADHGAMTYAALQDIRQSDLSNMQWRYDSCTYEEYFDGNHYDYETTQDAENAGIALTTANWVKKLVNDMRGIQESALTSWKVRGENPDHQDMYDALGAELFKAARLTCADERRIEAYAGQLKAGIGWIEVGYEQDPFKGKFFVEDVPWREMFFDMRARRCHLEDGQWVRRIKVYHKDKLKRLFSGVDNIDVLVEAAPTQASMLYGTYEIAQQQRAFQRRRSRDVQLVYSNKAKDQELRQIEEIWYPVYLEGLFAEMPDGKVILLDECAPMQLARLAQQGRIPVRKGAYTRWRRAIWVGDYKVDDVWSPFPWRGHPYIAFFGYREASTGVPYSPIRDMLSLQDEVNSAAAKFHAGMDHVRVIVEEDALSPLTSHNEVRDTIGDKRAYVIVKRGRLGAIKIDHHYQLSQQNYQRMKDAEEQLRSTSPLSGLNPAGVQLAGQQMDAATLKSLAGMGELNGNYRESSQVLGSRLLDLVKEDIAQRGDVAVVVRKHDGARVNVTLNRTLGVHHEAGRILANDVTLLHSEIALDDVPHTATYRGQQLQDLTKVLQSAPQDAAQFRILGTSIVVRLMDIPHANELADTLLKQAGLMQPQTQQEMQEAQAKAQEAQQQKELSLQAALAQIGYRKAQTEKLISDAALKHAMAQEKSNPRNAEYDAADRELILERTAVQNRRTKAQAAKIEAELYGQALQPAQQPAPQPGAPSGAPPEEPSGLI